jgi:hypothetical protein
MKRPPFLPHSSIRIRNDPDGEEFRQNHGRRHKIPQAREHKTQEKRKKNALFLKNDSVILLNLIRSRLPHFFRVFVV